MRPISELIWHCTATPEGREVSVDEIRRWHVKERGWSDIGYHKVVHLDGSVREGRPESVIGSHVAGRNAGTIGYVYVGGMSKDMKNAKDTRTPAQKATMRRLTEEAIERYGLKRVSGHRDYAAKACPSFNARAEYAPLLASTVAVADRDIGMPEEDPAAGRGKKKVIAASSGGMGVASLYDTSNQIQQADSHFSAGTMIGFVIGAVLIGIALYQLDAAFDHPVKNFITSLWRKDHV